MSNSTGSIRLDLINGDMAAFLTDLAPDESETFDGGELGQGTVARHGCTVFMVNADGVVSMHGHGDIESARTCYQAACESTREEQAHVLARMQELADLPAEVRATLNALADQVINGQMTLGDARVAYRANGTDVPIGGYV